MKERSEWRLFKTYKLNIRIFNVVSDIGQLTVVYFKIILF